MREAAAQGQITMDELEERLEATYTAKTFGELVPITADLPATSTSVPSSGLARAAGPAAAVSRIGGTPGPRHRSIAILSGAGRKGRWVVPAKYTTVAVLGGVELDLREATFAEQVTEINVNVLMGGVEIKVPEGVEVQIGRAHV